jgi:hypothetical protein
LRCIPWRKRSDARPLSPTHSLSCRTVNRFVAESTSPAFTALGSSPEEATETLRLIAIAKIGSGAKPDMLIARINEPGLCTIIMQPMGKAFTTECVQAWHYMASVPGPVLKSAE